MISKSCKNICLCANCVYNPFYAINTPKPCVGCFCDVCNNDEETMFCNHHLTIEEINKKIAERG